MSVMELLVKTWLSTSILTLTTGGTPPTFTIKTLFAGNTKILNLFG